MEALRFIPGTLEPALLIPTIYSLSHRAETLKEGNGVGDNSMHSYWGFGQPLGGRGGDTDEPDLRLQAFTGLYEKVRQRHKEQHQKVEPVKCHKRNTNECEHGIKGRAISF